MAARTAEGRPPPARCLAPDLIGMGRSGKPDIAYRFGDHARYLDAWFDALGLERAVLVGQDWGGALAFDRAARHPGGCAGLAFMETIVRPMTWEELPGGRPLALRGVPHPRRRRAARAGRERLHRAGSFAADRARRAAAPPTCDVYRAPYPTRDSRRPLLQWPRSMPLEGEPADVVARVDGVRRRGSRPAPDSRSCCSPSTPRPP